MSEERMFLLICGKVGAVRLLVAGWVIAHAQERESIVLANSVLFAQSFRASCSNRIVSVWLIIEVAALARRHCGQLGFARCLLGGFRWKWVPKWQTRIISLYV